MTDYKILVSHVDEKHLSNKILKSKDILHNALALSLKKAIKQAGINKIITFHPTIEAAKKASIIFKETIEDFDVFHISSDQNEKENYINLTGYTESKRAIITNAKSFNEGIDVPNTDAVMFCHPKNSFIDIVQSTGRAMRNSPDKKLGYIILPTFINGTSSNYGDYSNLIHVLSILSENDANLKDIMVLRNSDFIGFKTGIRKYLQVLADRDVDISALEKNIYVKILEKNNSFYDRYEELKLFKKKHGHCNVKTTDSGLGFWVKMIRKAYKEGTLTEAKIQLLEKLDFIFEIQKINFFNKIK